MSRFLISDEINMVLSASKFLRYIQNPQTRKNILKVQFVPPVLGSDTLGSYKITLKYERKQKPTFFTTED